jgi:hypothetical protein
MKRGGIQDSMVISAVFLLHCAAPVLSEVEGLHAGYVLRLLSPSAVFSIKDR